MTVAADLFPGGVNSPVRAYRAVGGEPPVLVRGEGAFVWNDAGRRYIDYVGAFGPLLLGHANRSVVEAIKNAAEAGGSFGVTGPGEVRLAQLIKTRMPSIERIRFVNSGTEAAMSALRVARAATRRDLIVKFEGGYHGHADSLLVEAGSGAATLSIPGSAGVAPSVAAQTLVATYNDLDSVAALLDSHRNNVAAVIVEPVAANMGVVAPVSGFLQGLRDLTERAGALLIFDEVITGFRVAPGGAQELFGVRPDLRTRGSPADPQLEQFFDFFQSETKLLRSSDEADARHRFFRVKTIIGCGACRLWQESRAFVEPHRRNSDFSQTRGPTDRQSAPICVRCFHLTINPKPCTSVQGQAVLLRQLRSRRSAVTNARFASLHGLHVVIGMSVLGWILWRTVQGRYTSTYYTGLELGGLYWHLVDLIWIFLYPLLYLI